MKKVLKGATVMIACFSIAAGIAFPVNAGCTDWHVINKRYSCDSARACTQAGIPLNYVMDEIATWQQECNNGNTPPNVYTKETHEWGGCCNT